VHVKSYSYGLVKFADLFQFEVFFQKLRGEHIVHSGRAQMPVSARQMEQRAKRGTSGVSERQSYFDLDPTWSPFRWYELC